MIAASGAELAGHLSVLSVTILILAIGGYRFSLQFEKGGEWQGNAPGLRSGWLFGRSMDLSDIQWRNFRGAFPALIAAMGCFVAVSHLVRRHQPSAGLSPVKSRSVDTTATGRSGTSPAKSWVADTLAASLASRVLRGRLGRPAVYLAFSTLFLGYLHGVTAIFPVALAALNFFCAHRVAGLRFGAAPIWGICIGALLAARIWDGFAFSSVSRWLGFLDEYRGAVKWEICFNLSLLRMLSFGLDLHWRQQRCRSQQALHQHMHGGHEISSRGSDGNSDGDGRQGSINGSGSMQNVVERSPQRAWHAAHDASSVQKPCETLQQEQHAEQAAGPAQRTAARQRQQQDLPSLDDYDLVTYLAYVFYPPLYLAGPIMTFHDFAWQLRQPVAIGQDQLMSYGKRFAADWLSLEVVTHTLYLNSVAKYGLGLKYSHRGLRYEFFEVALTGFWVLCFMWLKFATIWRFFRLVALVDGMEPPENMKRCFANNYDVEGFWKGWHSSYNAWLVRYMYIPLGGTRWRLLNIWPIFMFVALWHDLELRLMAWAWLVCLAFIPELLIKRAAATKAAAPWVGTHTYRHAAAALAALNICALMAVNLVGFVLGGKGLRLLAAQLLRQPGYLPVTFGVFYCAAQVMFWIRQREAAAAAHPAPPAPAVASSGAAGTGPPE